MTADLHSGTAKKFRRPVIDLQATGKKIRQLRILKKMTVHDLQQVFGFEYPQAIYLWEKGENLPSIDNLVVLAKIFECDISEIIVIKEIL